ncbi:RrF2 family transcriptional regulator [Breznakiellaceae bacterium SP9]
MRITTRGRYALRATLALAKLSSNSNPITIDTLSKQEDISSVFLEQIFFKLRKAGIVSSVRGPGGGFCFAVPLDRLTIKEILDAAGEELDVTDCYANKVSPCERIGECLAHGVWLELTHLLDDYFGGITLSSVLSQGKPIRSADKHTEKEYSTYC